MSLDDLQFTISRMTVVEKMRIMAAFQVLSMPSGMLGATHKSAKAALVQAFGETPKKTPPVGLSLDGYLTWFAESDQQTGDSAQ